MSINETIVARTAEVLPWVKEIRRDLHRHPEKSGSETRTSGVVTKTLRELGVEVHEGYHVTGLAGIIKGGLPGKTIGLRFDMDAWKCGN